MSKYFRAENYYAKTSYKPTKRVSWEQSNLDVGNINALRLSWYRRTQDNGASDEYGYNNIEISERWENKRLSLNVEDDDIFRAINVHYDNDRIMPPNYNFFSKILFIAMAFGKVGFYVFTATFFFVLLVLISSWLFGGKSSEYLMSAVKSSFLFSFSIVFFSLLLWKGGRLLENKFPDIVYAMRNKPLWQLNRKNGLFIIYDPKKAWEERLSAPFYEFDAYLESSPDTQGSPTYSLMLYHPETGVRQKLDAQFPPTNMPGELVAAWQFIQRYMDVSQPLPDVPALEIHRHKDPTTAAVDKRKGRNPRYWRDMTEAEVEKIQEEKYRKNIRLR
ncbi:hypothetical protein HW452_14475 [Halomonas aquamarina]|uniref:Uncharacterized protein n=1 Tax=Vreelandella aquamarina TaxID=77097 RepID=A0ACC5VXY5_9GAMM|nr:hypothetical protein [Halomonas aquamarina]MBZ5488730.1 hypothetical protein [Halomonas aquamarina]